MPNSLQRALTFVFFFPRGNLNGLELHSDFTAIVFHLLYGIIRAGDRDGAPPADERRAV